MYRNRISHYFNGNTRVLTARHGLQTGSDQPQTGFVLVSTATFALSPMDVRELGALYARAHEQARLQAEWDSLSSMFGMDE